MVRFIHDERAAPASSQVPLQVIAAGPPRAATSTMQAAMEQLGYTPCLHMAQIIPHPSRMQLMIDAVQEKNLAKREKLVHQLVDGYASLCDFPVCFFTPDLMDMYPDIKIILNQRENGEIWAKSAWDSLGFFFTGGFWLTGRLIQTDRLWHQLNMTATRWCKEKYDEDSLFTPAVYDKHLQNIREEAAKRGIEVLEFRPEQGWEPVCKFLGKEIPNTEFPRLNEKRAFQIIKAILIARGLLAYAALGGALWAAWRYGPSGLGFFRSWIAF